MSEVWVTNASPLILLARIGRLDFLERLASDIIVPAAVFHEVRAGQGKDPTAAFALDWAQTRRVPDIDVPISVEHWDLGSGESQVIAHALVGPRWAVLDDLAGRRCASTHGLPLIGTLGVVLRAKKRGVVDEAKPWLHALVAAGMFVDSAFLEQVLASVGE